MPGKPAARVGDQTAHGGVIMPPGVPMVLIGGQPAAQMNAMHVCPMQTPAVPPIPHVGGQIIATGVSVLVGGQPIAVVGDTAICSGGPPATIIAGCPTVLVGSGGGGGGGGGTGGEKAAKAESKGSEAEEGHKLDVKFADKGGNPITGVQYTVKSPDGEESKAPLAGRIKKSGIKEGNYEIELKAIVKAEWSKKTAEVEDTVKMKAQVAGIKSGTKATLEIFVKDSGPFADRLLRTVESKVDGDKIEEEWALKIDKKFIDLQAAKEGKGGYSGPSFYFRVTADGISTRSGILEIKDYIELELKDEDGNPIKGAGYKVFLPNGAIKEGTLDNKGYAKVEKVPPGQVKVSFDIKKSSG
ncbi:MAG: hypothetical protein CVT49_00210 [candidate division Zixibacteria bacterium HGW-Zixibacteria-1]|nr:MAG: hypothetical protein CVT49_00210 [candidate division Zixibacteria bacterium HGW-Zixibacteria-1]